MSYLKNTAEVWKKKYKSDNVEGHVFRVFGRYLKNELSKLNRDTICALDYGCGEGAALEYLKNQDLSVYGVDISEVAISVCKDKMSDIADNFKVIEPEPKIKDCFFNQSFDLVISIQALYYMNNSDLEIRLQSIYEQMNPGGIIYVSMVGTKCYWYKNSVPMEDGSRLVSFNNGRYKMSDHCMTFTDDESSLVKKFHMFEKLHVGYYDAVYLENEGSEFHYTYIGRKPL